MRRYFCDVPDVSHKTAVKNLQHFRLVRERIIYFELENLQPCIRLTLRRERLGDIHGDLLRHVTGIMEGQMNINSWPCFYGVLPYIFIHIDFPLFSLKK